MTNKKVFRVWAPLNKKWVDWVRPVPFVAIGDKTRTFQPSNFVLPCLSMLNKNDKTTAIIVDLPGTQSVEVGLLLAQHCGYRPIPIYNGVMAQKGSRATTDNHSIANALVWGASILPNITLEDDAPPVFLTDTNRLDSYKLDCSIFDNSWDVYPQDIPSEDYFIKNGITRIVVISNKAVSRDLKAIFNEYPKKQIPIFWTDGYEELKRISNRRRLFSWKNKRDD